MSTTTKSPLRVVRNALAVGRDVFRLYAHRRCPKLYTQPQLFACLALKAFFKTDYRGIAQYLRDLENQGLAWRTRGFGITLTTCSPTSFGKGWRTC
jgi:hypothetical protein